MWAFIFGDVFFGWGLPAFVKSHGHGPFFCTVQRNEIISGSRHRGELLRPTKRFNKILAKKLKKWGHFFNDQRLQRLTIFLPQKASPLPQKLLKDLVHKPVQK
jgi:hypothetical protein